ncbi:GTP-binding protein BRASSINAZOLE INSENSITIVE PALE GREEN 2, chloroplastic [Ricinus communis]|uniref:GTP-binding protein BRASSINAZOLE INSENSITIVE PALE GREEN 2, chloroplastic n=1 Tax=Ricinus communis TaxID=3988 RepID=UPI00201B0A57|nr:GTP-binding protein BRASSINAZOLE INSENSITIVE PALE GREEN 2, chloroplastic [Ricinus communis]
MILARNLSSSKSKLKPLFSLSIPSILSPLSNSNSNPQFYQYPLTFPPSLSYFSSKPINSKQPPPSLSPPLFLLTRDGNYDDATPPAAVCPGCGIHIQDSDPKQPGFFTKPSIKDPNYKSRSSLVPISLESEFSNSLKTGVVIDDDEAETHDSKQNPVTTTAAEKPIVCARCHSLRHYGKVKDPTVENLLPEFDFDSTVGKRLVSASGARSVVLLVVDAVDFDGSFPKKVAKLVSSAIEENFNSWKEGKSGNVPRIVLVVTKIDLLPTTLSPTRFEHWVRQRAREGGASVIKKVHFVSAVRDWGLKDLVDDVIKMAGARGNVWAVGMQNAGKSTLINAMGKWTGGGERKLTHLTEAPVPGTTLGIVRVEGVLPGQAKLFDTPGLLNPHQITTRLSRDEQKLVHISKELKARTYRIKEGHSVHIGGLIRLDIEELSVDSIYVTVWASPYLPLHMGKTENASTMLADHFGHQLQPPIGEKRVEELGRWVRREFSISGSNWDSSSVDISAAGLGWYAIGLKGEAVVGVWTYEGVDVVLRNPLIPFRSQTFEVAGFTVSKIVSKADKALNKSQHKSENNRKGSDQKVSAVDESSLSTRVHTGASSC